MKAKIEQVLLPALIVSNQVNLSKAAEHIYYISEKKNRIQKKIN